MLLDSLPRPTSPAALALLLTLFTLPTAHAAGDDRDQEKSSAPTRASVPSSPQPLSGPMLETHADALVAQHQYLAAIHLYETIPLPAAPLLNKLGIAYEQMRLYPQARLNYEQALSLNPKFSGPENNLGTVFYVQGDYRRAEQHYKKALKIDPHNASIYNNLGTLYFTKRKIHKGVEAYQQAQSLDPEIFQRNAGNSIQTDGSRESRVLINFYLAETCADAGRSAAALLYLRRAVDAGFHDHTKLRGDQHFAQLRDNPEFKELLLNIEHAGNLAVAPAPPTP